MINIRLSLGCILLSMSNRSVVLFLEILKVLPLMHCNESDFKVLWHACTGVLLTSAYSRGLVLAPCAYFIDESGSAKVVRTTNRVWPLVERKTSTCLVQCPNRSGILGKYGINDD
jgi:hypothetical protein